MEPVSYQQSNLTSAQSQPVLLIFFEEINP